MSSELKRLSIRLWMDTALGIITFSPKNYTRSCEMSKSTSRVFGNRVDFGKENSSYAHHTVMNGPLEGYPITKQNKFLFLGTKTHIDLHLTH